ncbi:MAG: MDR family MFS transporter [Candidatus Cohnella colombiensis]|uniref:MDR family MFS transporter n=1 Tax=Candidatus Cohnella colombiensis TaxID=3121368 RepID=A0AA95JGP5_9BACL|nr:MAG: MDR family MFS transporter [Cohnella sp.]
MTNKQTNRTIVTIGLLTAVFIGALDATVVTTATPSIEAELKGLTLISWIFSIYTLSMCMAMPIFGKLADLYGRKLVFITGLSLFLLGSVLCGFAQSMFDMIWFRAIQGLGAGALTPVTFTIVGDLYTGEKRGRIQGLFASVWSVAGIVGPFVGGYFVDQISWRWIFYMNVPISLITFVLVYGFLHEKVDKVAKKIDYAGAITFTISITCLLLVLLTGGETFPWNSPTIATLTISAITFFSLFLFVEKRAPEPMMPLKLFQQRKLAVIYILGFLMFCIEAGLMLYTPMWSQRVMGHNATTAGFMLMPMSVAWLLASTLSGRLMYRIGVKIFMVLGAFMIVAGGLWLALLNLQSPIGALIGIVMLIGFGMGCMNTPAIVTIQSAVEKEQRGSATSTNSLMNAIGQTVGFALFGMLFNRVVLEKTVDDYATGMHAIFVAMFIIAIINFVIVQGLPSRRSEL